LVYIGNQYRCTNLGKPLRAGCPDTRRAACYQGDPPFQTLIFLHHFPPPLLNESCNINSIEPQSPGIVETTNRGNRVNLRVIVICLTTWTFIQRRPSILGALLR
jgi:hypothetical protein